MNRAAFDRIARALDEAVSRRAGAKTLLGAAVAAVLAGRVAPPPPAATAARRTRGRVRPEGPCGDGSRKANVCGKDDDCCTGFCDTRIGKRNHDGKGRCRCRKKGAPCTARRNCCGGRSCVDGVCRGTPAPKPVPTGDACVPATQVCADPQAACVPYFDNDPAGTWCLVPEGGECTGHDQCASHRCLLETCQQPCVPDVCATCQYTTIQEAIDAAPDGATIRIGEGTYEQELAIPKSLTLEACTTATIIRCDVGRTITITAGTVELKHLTVASNAPAMDDAVTGVWGGIYCVTGLVLSGGTRIEGCYSGDSYGGAVIMPAPNASLVMKDAAAIVGCKGRMAGAIYAWSASIVLQDEASIANCSTKSPGAFGGAILQRGGSFAMHDDAAIRGCTASYLGGGAALLDTVGVMNGRSTITGCTASIVGGGLYLTSPSLSGGGLTMNDSASITGNTGVVVGGGVDAVGADIVMNGNAVISGNSSSIGAGVFLGVETNTSKPSSLVMSGAAAITGNTADNTGGGVYSGDAACTLTLGTGIIDGNSPNQCAGDGIAC